MGHRECLVGALTISLPPEIDLRNLPARRVVIIPTELTRATIFHSTSRMTNQETQNEDRTLIQTLAVVATPLGISKISL